MGSACCFCCADRFNCLSEGSGEENKMDTDTSTNTTADVKLNARHLTPQINYGLEEDTVKVSGEENKTNINGLSEVVTNDQSNSRKLNPQINYALEVEPN